MFEKRFIYFSGLEGYQGPEAENVDVDIPDSSNLGAGLDSLFNDLDQMEDEQEQTPEEETN